ncbi:MAG TPA: hypothetical protein VGM53_20095 [Streptosporangiaceae bacterium]|jgi:hypothetical protein
MRPDGDAAELERFLIGPTAATGRQIGLRWLPATPASLAHLTLHIPAASAG